MKSENCYEKYKNLDQKSLNDRLSSACRRGWADEVKCLLSSPYLTLHAEANSYNSFGLRIACMKGHYDVVKCLIEAIDLENPVDIDANNGESLGSACYNGNLEMVKLLMKAKKDYSSLKVNNTALISACLEESLEVVKYLLSVKSFSDNVDKEAAFMRCIEDNLSEMNKYFVFEQNMKKTHRIKQCLMEYPNTQVETYFLFHTLNETLVEKPQNSNRIKV